VRITDIKAVPTDAAILRSTLNNVEPSGTSVELNVCTAAHETGVIIDWIQSLESSLAGAATARLLSITSRSCSKACNGSMLRLGFCVDTMQARHTQRRAAWPCRGCDAWGCSVPQ
jgi:hypothetical protein